MGGLLMVTISESNRTGIDGKIAAQQVLDEMAGGNRPFLLGYAAKAMIERGEFGAYEIGFFQHLAERLA